MGSGVSDFMPVYGCRTPPRPVPILDLVDEKGERERERSQKDSEKGKRISVSWTPVFMGHPKVLDLGPRGE